MTTPRWVLISILVLSACAVRDEKYDPSRFTFGSRLMVPPDVIAPKGMRGGSVIDGLHVEAANGKTENLCCWIDTTTHVRVMKEPGSRMLQIGAYIPKDVPFEKTPQRLTVHFSNGESLAFGPMGPGSHAQTLRLPHSITPLHGAIDLSITASERWAPRDLPKSHYAALLLSIVFD